MKDVCVWLAASSDAAAPLSWLLTHSHCLFQGAAQGIPPLLVLAKQKKGEEQDRGEGKMNSKLLPSFLIFSPPPSGVEPSV